MPERSLAPDATQKLLWQRLKAEVAQHPPLDASSLCDLVEAVMTDWSSNPVAMHKVLRAGVACGDVPDSVLSLWDARFEPSSRPRLAPANAVPPTTLPSTQPASLPTAPAVAPSSAADATSAADDEALHPLLRPIVTNIETCRSRQGRDALALGRLLTQARVLCDRHGLRFEFFLRYLERQLGIHRASSYLYMKFVECGFPTGLGTAVMKWIVQGFAAGGEPAHSIAQRALVERLSLADLEARYGSLRRPQDPVLRGGDRTRPTSRRDDTARALRLARCQKRRASLLLKRAQLDAELARLDEELQSLESPPRASEGLPPPPAPPDVAPPAHRPSEAFVCVTRKSTQIN